MSCHGFLIIVRGQISYFITYEWLDEPLAAAQKLHANTYMRFNLKLYVSCGETFDEVRFTHKLHGGTFATE